MEALKGKKTYIAAALMALGAIGAFMADQIQGPELFEAILTAAAFAGLRAAK